MIFGGWLGRILCGARGDSWKGESLNFESKRQTDTQRVEKYPKKAIFRSERVWRRRNPEIYTHKDTSINTRRLLPSATHPSDFVLFVFGVTVTQTFSQRDKTHRMDECERVDKPFSFLSRSCASGASSMMAWSGFIGGISLSHFIFASCRAIRKLLRRNSFCLFNNCRSTCKKSI